MKVQMKERKSGKLVWIEAEDIVVVGTYDLKVFVEDINERSYYVNFEQPLSIKEWINAMRIMGELMSGILPEEFNKEVISYNELIHAIQTSDRWMSSLSELSHFPLRHSLKLRAEAKLKKLWKFLNSKTLTFKKKLALKLSSI